MRQDQKEERASSCTDSPTFQGQVKAGASQPCLMLPGKALPAPAMAEATTNILISISGPQQNKLSLARASANREVCPHHIPGAGQHQARTPSPSNSITWPTLPPEMLGEEAAALGFSAPEEDLNTRTQISGRGIGHSHHMGPSPPGTPHESHPSPAPNTTLLVDRSVQAHLVQPCLCLAYPRRDTSSPSPSFPGQVEALQGGSSLPLMIQKQKLEGKDKSACPRIQQHNMAECTRLR